MIDEIKVHVVRYPDRENYVLRYCDPGTGKHVTKSAETNKKSEATKAAGKWQAELREGRYQKPSRMLWDAFTDYYCKNALPAMAESSRPTYEATLNVFEEICKPQRLSNVTTTRVTFFATELRVKGRTEATVARHLRHLKVMMRWAHRQGLLAAMPEINMPKRVRGAKIMRGRPIATEEFERMLSSVAKVVENAAAESWRFYLRGLWESGLRLSESLTLRWDDAPGAIVVDFTGRRPMLRIPAEAEKGNQDRMLPMTPEFAALLQCVSDADRRGRVFKLLRTDASPMPANRRLVGAAVSAIGKAAGVVVDERTKRIKADGNKPAVAVRKFASAHDLRRAFGQRWAAKLMPAQLRELMRHTDIATTMKFYVGQNAEATADVLWAATGNTLGNTHSQAADADAKNT